MRGSMSTSSMSAEPQEYSKEFIDFERNELYKELFNSMQCELKSADKFSELAESAELMGNNSLKQSMMNMAKQRLSNFEEIRKEIETMYPGIKQEVLYILYEGLLDWHYDLAETLAEMR